MILFILPSVRPAVVRSDREEAEEEDKEEERKEGRGLIGVPWVSVSVRLYTCIRGAKEYMLYCG